MNKLEVLNPDGVTARMGRREALAKTALGLGGGFLSLALTGCSTIFQPTDPRYSPKDDTMNPTHDAMQVINNGHAADMYELSLRTPHGAFSYHGGPLSETNKLFGGNVNRINIPKEFQPMLGGRSKAYLFELNLSKEEGEWQLTYTFFNGERKTTGQGLSRNQGDLDFVIKVKVPDQETIEKAFLAR